MPMRKLFFFSFCVPTHMLPCAQHSQLARRTMSLEPDVDGWTDGHRRGTTSTSQGLALQPNKHTVIDGFLVSDQCWASRQRTHLTTDGKVAAATIEFTVYEKTGQVFVQFYLLCMILFSLRAGRCMLHPALLGQHTSYRLTERLNRCRSSWLCIS